jgi:ketosteroid isomerase-like protein
MSSNAEIVKKFTAAQNARDEKAIAALLAEDAHFESARLPIVADGREAVTKSLTDWLDAHTDYELTTVREFYAGDEGYNEWRFKAKKDGEPIETHGVDYYRFKDGLIVEKNSFRKFLF